MSRPPSRPGFPPPADLPQALRDGGIPRGVSEAGLAYLADQHEHLATSRFTPLKGWRLRWAAFCTDLLETRQEARRAAMIAEMERHSEAMRMVEALRQRRLPGLPGPAGPSRPPDA